MRRNLELTYVDSEINEYNPQYVTISFTDKENNNYTWNVTANTKAYVRDFIHVGKGDLVNLVATVEKSTLTRVKIL